MSTAVILVTTASLFIGRWWGITAARRDAKKLIREEREWWANAASVYGADTERLKADRERE